MHTTGWKELLDPWSAKSHVGAWARYRSTHCIAIFTLTSLNIFIALCVGQRARYCLKVDQACRVRYGDGHTPPRASSAKPRSSKPPSPLQRTHRKITHEVFYITSRNQYHLGEYWISNCATVDATVRPVPPTSSSLTVNSHTQTIAWWKPPCSTCPEQPDRKWSHKE